MRNDELSKVNKDLDDLHLYQKDFEDSIRVSTSLSHVFLDHISQTSSGCKRV
jgi:hypothetical protein